MITDDTAAWIGLDLLGVTFNSVRSPDALRQPKELLEALLHDGDPTIWLHRKPRHRNWRLTPQTLYGEATRVVRRMRETGIWVQPGIEVPGFIQAPRPPLVVYGWGNRDLLNNRSLGVVGTREPSAMAVARTEKWVSAWVHDGLQIASGGARGIDSVAHRAALPGNDRRRFGTKPRSRAESHSAVMGRPQSFETVLRAHGVHALATQLQRHLCGAKSAGRCHWFERGAHGGTPKLRGDPYT